jgi:hypothetical protein
VDAEHRTAYPSNILRMNGSCISRLCSA